MRLCHSQSQPVRRLPTKRKVGTVLGLEGNAGPSEARRLSSELTE